MTEWRGTPRISLAGEMIRRETGARGPRARARKASAAANADSGTG
jgi:hypothetical protein